MPIKRDLYRRHASALDTLSDDKERFDRFCELNVFEQAVNVGNTTVVRDAWARGRPWSNGTPGCLTGRCCWTR